MKQNPPKRPSKKSIMLSLLFLGLFTQNLAMASAVKVCKKLKEDTKVDSSRDIDADKKVYCTITPQLGVVGDYVEIKNQYNYIVAIGRVIKQGRIGTIVVLTKSDPSEGSMAGYPAMIRINESQDYWTASAAPF